MVISLIDKGLHKYRRQKKLALCMWYDIIIALQHENENNIGIRKRAFVEKHNLEWFNDCFLCHLFMKFKTSDDRYAGMTCTDCPLEKKYKGQATYGCSAEDHTTAYARVIDIYLSKEKRIAAAWEIIEAIKSVTNYLILMTKAERCARLALEYYHKHEVKLAVFWNNAAKEFKERALALKVGD